MLKEEQAAELLRRCEATVGRRLSQARGNLRNARTRAEAVWELLLLEAAAGIGPVEYETPGGGPDIRLELPTGRWVSIEVTYVHPRFEEDESRSRLVTRWIYDAAKDLVGPHTPEIDCQFYGDKTNPAGPRRTLPAEHQRKEFLKSAPVQQFLCALRERPGEAHEVVHNEYTVTLKARPWRAKTEGIVFSGGTPPELPRIAKEHAAFRAVRRKIEQHKLDEPHIVCLGSDVSSALELRHMGTAIPLEQALAAAVSQSRRLSGILVAKIGSESAGGLGQWIQVARAKAFPVHGCRHPLTDEEWRFILQLNLNKWMYTFALARRELAPEHRRPKVTGPLGWSGSKRGTMKLQIPAPVLVNVLAGRKRLLDEYGGSTDTFGRSVLDRLEAGWSVVGCEFKAGNLEQGEASSVFLELAPPHEPVYWPPKSAIADD